MRYFGLILKKLRKSQGLTQEQLSHKLNLSRSQIKNWETNRYEPDIETLIIIASFFNVSVDTLIGFESKFDGEPLQELLSNVQTTYAALNEQQRGRFCKQVSILIEMLENNQDVF
ncbi:MULTISPECIES: helix-turn-helix domain-containing protein [Bacillus cereus group]|uniref:Transcriptional regulator n=1 Tax=Bacillus thuringiensis subsp. medellin TaxID=79672 RepID=A0A9X6MWG8_BACTV|nr:MULTISPECIES: helix-turn-helix transcriptional regulator [Bacillus cereus group]OUB92492.1 transcriptional regulator [Bacillus thuringiensis serovar medellin]